MVLPKNRNQLPRSIATKSKPAKANAFRGIFRTAAKASVAATLLFGGLKVGEKLHERSAEKKKQEIELVKQVDKAGFKKESQPIFRIYKLNPTNRLHATTVKALEGMSKSTKLSPARIMLTIESNMDNIEGSSFSRFLFDSLRSNSSVVPANRARNERILSVLTEFNQLPASTRENLLEMALKKGTYQELKKETGTD